MYVSVYMSMPEINNHPQKTQKPKKIVTDNFTVAEIRKNSQRKDDIYVHLCYNLRVGTSLATLCVYGGAGYGAHVLVKLSQAWNKDI